MAVANVDIQVDARSALQQLKAVNQQAQQLESSANGATSAITRQGRELQTASNGMRYFVDATGRARAENGRFLSTAERAAAGIRNQGQAAERTSQQMQGLGQSAQASSGKIGFVVDALKGLAPTLAAADLVRRYFKGFDEAQKAAAAVRTLGVDSDVLEARLLGVSNRLNGLYSQTQLVTAAYDVASSGFADASSAAKILEASAKGATGGLSDINVVANATTSVLNAYGKSADDAAALIDGFIQTQNDGKIVLNEYAQQIGRLAPTAAAAGIGINEINAAIATITAQGVPVEATFTGLNQALVSILKPTAEAEKLAMSLGIQFNETGLRTKGFAGLLQEVKEKTGGSTTKLVELFGSVDALKAILPLVNDDLVNYNKNVKRQAEVTGVADKATEELGGTVSSEITKAVNQIGNLVRALDTVLGPALGGIVKLINLIIQQATKGINVLGQLFSMDKNTTVLKVALEAGDLSAASVTKALPGIDELIGEQRRKELQRQAGAGTGFLGLGMNMDKFEELLKKQPEIKRLLGSGSAVRTPAAAENLQQQMLGQQVGTTGTTAGADKAAEERERAAKAAEEEAKRVRQVITDRTAETELLDTKIRLADRINAAESDGDQMLAERLRGQQTLIDLQYKYAQQLAAEPNVRAQEAIARQGIMEMLGAQFETEYKLNEIQKQRNQDQMNALQMLVEKQYEMNTAIQQQIALADSVSASLGKGLTSTFDLLISGVDNWAASLQQIASGVLVDIANQLIRIYVIEQAINAIKTFLTPFSYGQTPIGAGGGSVGGKGTFGPNYGLPARATGGSVTAGQPYLVGERGPELFMPGKSGGIAPAGSFGGMGNIVVNVDASGSSVQGDTAQGNKLGQAVGAAVRQELINQKRPGGLLA